MCLSCYHQGCTCARPSKETFLNNVIWVCTHSPLYCCSQYLKGSNEGQEPRSLVILPTRHSQGKSQGLRSSFSFWCSEGLPPLGLQSAQGLSDLIHPWPGLWEAFHPRSVYKGCSPRVSRPSRTRDWSFHRMVSVLAWGDASPIGHGPHAETWVRVLALFLSCCVTHLLVITTPLFALDSHF